MVINRNKLFSTLRKTPLKKIFLEENYGNFEDIKFQGLNIIEKNDFIYLNSTLTKFEDEIFIIFDLEFNKENIIEIGAVKLQNGKIIDTFNRLIYQDDLDKYVSKITGITLDMLLKEKSSEIVLNDFKLFIKDYILVAHSAKTDYNLLSLNMDRCGLKPLLNEYFCTQKLTKKLLNSEKSSLPFLKDIFNIDIKISHRAYSDALTTTHLLKRYFKIIPRRVKTTADLIKFIS